ncbi:MAG: hypothetical protein CMH56_01985 [Myxococcales bacterium]|nr:hypothetical protein [Myxococcales bacterium]|tara:strand:- start:63 stop:245 length:183 start_codon:yes stop_codon:yes gene_type:complete
MDKTVVYGKNDIALVPRTCPDFHSMNGTTVMPKMMNVVWKHLSKISGERFCCTFRTRAVA